jgi:nitroreductase
MSALFPDRQSAHAAMLLATRAPSVHNSQPWRWRVTTEGLHLYADPDRHLPNIDPDSRDLLLSCGAALHHAVVALAAMGWQAKVTRLPDELHPTLLATIAPYRQPASELDIALAAAIPKRRTDRRHYAWWPIPAADIKLMGSRAAGAGVVLRRVESLPKLRSIVAQAVWRHATDQDYLTELAAWSGRYGSSSGVPARNIPPSDPTSPIPGRFFAGAALTQPPETAAADDGAVVLALGTGDDSKLSRLQAGEATSLVLLTATALGLSSCPVTEPLEIAETREAVRVEVLGDDTYPQMLLRIGWAPVNADPLPPTPRRPLAEVVTWLDGSPLQR